MDLKVGTKVYVPSEGKLGTITEVYLHEDDDTEYKVVIESDHFIFEGRYLTSHEDFKQYSGAKWRMDKAALTAFETMFEEAVNPVLYINKYDEEQGARDLIEMGERASDPELIQMGQDHLERIKRNGEGEVLRPSTLYTVSMEQEPFDLPNKDHVLGDPAGSIGCFIHIDTDINPNGIDGIRVGRTWSISLEMNATVRPYRCQRRDEMTICKYYHYAESPAEVIKDFITWVGSDKAQILLSKQIRQQ